MQGLGGKIMKFIEIKRYDITVVEKVDQDAYKIYCIYPNEDNGKLTPVVWQSHHYWNPEEDGTIENFCNEIESSAYLDEDFENLEQVATMWDKEPVWFNTIEELEEYVKQNNLTDENIAVKIWM